MSSRQVGTAISKQLLQGKPVTPGNVLQAIGKAIDLTGKPEEIAVKLALMSIQEKPILEQLGANATYTMKRTALAELKKIQAKVNSEVAALEASLE